MCAKEKARERTRRAVNREGRTAAQSRAIKCERRKGKGEKAKSRGELLGHVLRLTRLSSPIVIPCPPSSSKGIEGKYTHTHTYAVQTN